MRPRTEAPAAAPGEARLAGAIRPLRVLIVDDEQLDRVIVRRMLAQLGGRVELHEAATSDELIHQLNTESWDCVLLDYYLPGTDSVELLHRIRRSFPHLAIVIFTGRGDEEVAVELMKAGATDYLPKGSLTAERLSASLRYSVELARAGAERHAAECALRANEARLRRITESGIIGVFYWMQGGRIHEANREFCRMLGWAPEDAAAGRLDWQALTPPEWQPLYQRKQRELLEHNAASPWEQELFHRDGHRVPVLFCAALLDGYTDRGFGLCLDISERKRAEAERERLLASALEARTQREQALRQREQALRQRDEMLGVVAHDLRNPVHTIAMIVSALIELELGEEERTRMLANVRRAARTMERLIRDLLEVTQIESGELPIRRAAVPVAPLIDETVGLFEPLASVRRIRLTGSVVPGVPAVHADRDRLAQVLSNLLGNALQYTPDAGRIDIAVRNTAEGVRFSVIDTGAGIPTENIPRIFDRFWRGERAAGEGAGLGLAIAKGIIDAHGGRIWAESEKDRGTAIHFIIPAAPSS